MSVAGFLLFTLGSMNHHTTSEGTGATWGATLASAAIAAFLAQKYYQRAIAGVAGKILVWHPMGATQTMSKFPHMPLKELPKPFHSKDLLKTNNQHLHEEAAVQWS